MAVHTTIDHYNDHYYDNYNDQYYDHYNDRDVHMHIDEQISYIDTSYMLQLCWQLRKMDIKVIVGVF